MRLVLAGLAAASALAACGERGTGAAPPAGAPADLVAPTPVGEPARAYAAINDFARAATGDIDISVALNLPDADDQSGAAQETLSLSSAQGWVLEAAVTNTISPATQVQGQTLRSLMSLPVEEPQALVYRVARETKPAGRENIGLCGLEAPGFVVVWEPSGPAADTMKLMGVTGGAPGAASARACPMLEYRRP